MIFYSFKNSIKEWIMAQPCLRKIIFRKRVETKKILSRFLENHHFCGYSFVKETTFLTATPTKSEVYEVFINLDNLVNVFLDELTCSKPNLQEIAFSDTITHSNVIAIKYMTTIYKDSLLVSTILFFEKNIDGTWNLVTRKTNSNFFLTGYQEDKDKFFKNYPKSLKINFYDSFGNENCISQENFDYYEDRFFSF